MTSQQGERNFPPSETTPLIQPDADNHVAPTGEEQARREEVEETRTWPILIATILSIASAVTSLVLNSVLIVRTRDPPLYATPRYQYFGIRRIITLFVRIAKLL